VEQVAGVVHGDGAERRGAGRFELLPVEQLHQVADPCGQVAGLVPEELAVLLHVRAAAGRVDDHQGAGHVPLPRLFVLERPDPAAEPSRRGEPARSAGT
jgi:hypothetical protein